MSRLVALQGLGFLLICIVSAASASTIGGKSLPCSYKNIKHPSLNIRGICQVKYGVIGHTGQAYRYVTWPDGVMTLIKITAGGALQKSVSATIDQYSGSAMLSCGHETYTIFANTIELKGDLCR